MELVQTLTGWNCLGGCPKIDQSTADEPDWPDFAILFVKEPGYSPQMLEKSNSISLALATIAILGQAPSPYPRDEKPWRILRSRWRARRTGYLPASVNFSRLSIPGALNSISPRRQIPRTALAGGFFTGMVYSF
jgi:hypothetical protein